VFQTQIPHEIYILRLLTAVGGKLLCFYLILRTEKQSQTAYLSLENCHPNKEPINQEMELFGKKVL